MRASALAAAGLVGLGLCCPPETGHAAVVTEVAPCPPPDHYYKRLITARDGVRINLTGTFPDPGVRWTQTWLLGDAWQQNPDVGWSDVAQPPGGRTVTVKALPVPSVADFIATNGPLASPAPEPVPGYYDLRGGTGDVRYYWSPGDDPENSDFSVFTQAPSPVIDVTGAGSVVWMAEHGFRFDFNTEVRGTSDDCLILVSPRNGREDFNPQMGQWFFGGIVSPVVPVVLVSDDEVRIEHFNDHNESSQVGYLAIFARAAYFMGPIANWTMTLAHTPGATEDVAGGLIDRLCDLGALPNCPTGAAAAVLSPNGGEILLVGVVAPITWSTSGLPLATQVGLELSRDSGETWEAISTDEPNDGVFDWVVTPPATGAGATPVYSALLRVTANTDSCIVSVDASDAPFAIHDLATPTLLRRFEATRSGEGVVARWEFAEGNDEDVELQHASRDAGPWTAVDGVPSRDGNGWVQLDRQVKPGKSYWYRLADRANGRIHGAIAITMSPTSSLARLSVGPNPASNGITVGYSLPRDAHVRATLLDLQGRTVATIFEGWRDAGPHEHVWTASEAAPRVSGVFILSLESSVGSVTRKVVFVR